jgi:hypothetical protein
VIPAVMVYQRYVSAKRDPFPTILDSRWDVEIGETYRRIKVAQVRKHLRKLDALHHV